jgi:hypothetical protein
MREVTLPNDDGSLEAQLLALYTGQKLLLERLGTSDPNLIIAMFDSMEEQLVALYADADDSEDMESKKKSR